MKDWYVWYNNGTGWYESAGIYQASGPEQAIEMARQDGGLRWCGDIVATNGEYPQTPRPATPAIPVPLSWWNDGKR